MADNHMWGNRFLMNMNMNMNMANMMSGNSTTDDASSQFSMTFSSWSIYKLQFLFLSWDIQTPWQFTLTWFAVAFAVVVWHFLGCAEHCLDKAIFTLLSKKSILSEQNISTGLMDEEPKKSKGDIELVCDSHETSHSIHDLKSDRVSTASHIYEHHNGRLYTSAHSIRPRARRPIGWHVVKTMHGLLTATKYILSLFLMLTAMTMIPSLMLALFVGYWVGDIIFADFLIDMDMDACAPLFEEGGVVGVLLRWALLAPIGSVFHHQLVKQVLPEESPLLRSSSEKTNTEAPTNWYKLILGTLPRVISLIVIILTLVWIVTVQGGFGYESFNAFGWHALTMIFFAAMFTNEALLTYRAPLLPQLANNRDYLRYFHTISHVGGLTSIILGLYYIAQYKSLQGLPDSNAYPAATMYSAHSWMGVLTVALFGIQCLFSIVLFAVMKWPEGSEKKKEDWKGVHQFMGHCLFALALATCATGFQGMQSSDLAASYASTMPMDDAMIANATMAAYQGDDVAPDGYSFKSVKSQLASAASIMLIVLGISTFAVIRFLPLVPINQPEVFVPCDKDYK